MVVLNETRMARDSVTARQSCVGCANRIGKRYWIRDERDQRPDRYKWLVGNHTEQFRSRCCFWEYLTELRLSRTNFKYNPEFGRFNLRRFRFRQ